MSLLQIDGVTAGYHQIEILHDVSLTVRPGEVVTIIGPNGAGKSTLMRAAFGLIKVKKGDIKFRGASVKGLKPNALVRLGMSFVPQSDNVFASLSVQENLEMGGSLRRDNLQQTIEKILTMFPILRIRRRTLAGGLSGGERQMLALGRALMLDPALLLLDEPSAGLSPRMIESTFDKIVEISASGVSFMLVEQNARAALSISHRAYVLVAGQNRLEGTGSELLRDPEIGRLYLGAR